MTFHPHFIGIGAEKAGTTWICSMLARHPKIDMSEPKEIHYFNKYSSSLFKDNVNKNFNRPIEWYKKRFQHCRNIMGEFSTQYLYDTEAPKKIHEIFPDVKLILSLRDPVQRAYSQYWMYRNYLGLETRNFETAIIEEPEYVQKGMYSVQLKRYLSIFSKKQMHVIFFEDLVKDPTFEMNKVFAFLGVGSFETNSRCKNRSKSARLAILGRAMGPVSNVLIDMGLSGLVRNMKSAGLKNAFDRLNTRNFQYPRMKKSTRVRLREEFAGDHAELSEMFGALPW